MVLHSLTKMRIVAIPLTRPGNHNTLAITSLNRLTYYQFQISGEKQKGKKKGVGNTPKEEGWRAWPAQIRSEGLADWTTQKATEVWNGFGKAKGGWKLRVYTAGERLVDRMDFEELALKSVDPRLAPNILSLAQSKDGLEHKIPLIFPPSQLESGVALRELRAYAAQRIPRHRKGLFLWAAVAPLTAPFMLIPIIPNLPFFFCVWRAWSHYRAYKASQYLEMLLDNKIIVPEPSDALDNIYRSKPTALLQSRSSPKAKSPLPPHSPSPSPSSETSDSGQAHILLLTRAAVPALLSGLQLEPESAAAADVYRAIDQAKMRVEKGDLGL